MDSFKYIGDENLVFSDEEDEEDEEEEKKIREEIIEIKTKPMEQIFEIVLNNKPEKIDPPQKKDLQGKIEKKMNKKKKWVKYYI